MQTSEARRRARDRSERGAGLVEYALLVALIAVVCLTAVTFVGTSGAGKFDKAGKGIGGLGSPAASTTTTNINDLPWPTDAVTCNTDPRGMQWIRGQCYINGNG